MQSNPEGYGPNTMAEVRTMMKRQRRTERTDAFIGVVVAARVGEEAEGEREGGVMWVPYYEQAVGGREMMMAASFNFRDLSMADISRCDIVMNVPITYMCRVDFI
jgi:hypothetical protein